MDKVNVSTEKPEGSLASLPTVKRDALMRIKTIIGHSQGIEKMINSDRYCIELLKQISAVQAQLRGLGHVLTKSHLEICMSDAIREGRGEEMIEEFGEALKYLD
jgi:DNA-binding FrmR family transcriptional regulator